MSSEKRSTLAIEEVSSLDVFSFVMHEFKASCVPCPLGHGGFLLKKFCHSLFLKGGLG